MTTPLTPYVVAQDGIVASEGDPGTLACTFVVPCVGYTLKSMGLNASSIAGKPVILATDVQKSVTGLPLLIAETTTTVDESTPAPLPAGASSATLAPELLDMVPPIVTAAPPTLAFTLSTMLPAMATLSFTLVSAFPNAWSLVLLNTLTKTSTDVTNGHPGGLTLAPSGGGWSSAPLTVTATLTASFMAAQGAGTHWFYMTGVSKRGLTGFIPAILVVS
jgi:hypothetical protein